MVRVLQLLPTQAPFEAERAAFTLSKLLGDEFQVEVRTIGPGGDFRDRWIASALLRRTGARFDVIHAWGATSLIASALGTTKPIVFGALTEAGVRPLRLLRAVMNYRRVEVICPTSTLRRMLVERGVPLERCHLIRPGVDFARIKRRRDPELRAQLRLGEDDRVVLAAGESTRPANHAQALWAVSILHVLEPRYKLIVWGRGLLADSVLRLAHKINGPGALRVAEHELGHRVEFEELLPATDIVLVTARGAVSTLPISICMGAGLPIISTVSYTLGELLEDRHTALLCGTHQPREIARRIRDLEESPSLQWSIADVARTEAYEYFAQTRFVQQHREVYRQLAANQPVEVSQPAPGAGLRFHGRV